MTKTYHVYLVTPTHMDGDLVGRFADKAEAMTAAKRAARTRRDCEVYGPSSICFVGRDATAVVSW